MSFGYVFGYWSMLTLSILPLLSRPSPMKYRRHPVQEHSIIEAQLVECKLAVAQARGSREQIALRYRELEKQYCRLKFELANTKQSEDDSLYMIEQYKRIANESSNISISTLP